MDLTLFLWEEFQCFGSSDALFDGFKFHMFFIAACKAGKLTARGIALTIAVSYGPSPRRDRSLCP